MQAAYPSGPYSGEVFSEYPVSTEIAKSVASSKMSTMISLWPTEAAAATTRNPVERKFLNLPTPGTTAEITESGALLTIGGTPATGDVVHAFFGDPLLDAAVKVTQGQTAAQIASAIAAAVTAYESPGVEASASGNTVSISGATFSQVNVGASGSMLMEITRVERLFDVTVWASTSEARLAIGEAILAVLGGANQPTLLCSDGTRANIWYKSDKLDDAPSESYSLFTWRLGFRIEYGITQEVDVTQVEGVEWTQQLGSLTRTFYSGGTP